MNKPSSSSMCVYIRYNVIVCATIIECVMVFKTRSTAKSRVSAANTSVYVWSTINTRNNYTPKLKVGVLCLPTLKSKDALAPSYPPISPPLNWSSSRWWPLENSYSAFTLSWSVKKREYLGRLTCNRHETCFNQLHVKIRLLLKIWTLDAWDSS